MVLLGVFGRARGLLGAWVRQWGGEGILVLNAVLCIQYAGQKNGGRSEGGLVFPARGGMGGW